MYEERRDTFSIKDVLLEILLIILFVLILICIFPTKNHIKKLLSGNKTEEQTKVEASADDIDRLASLYNQVFATNIYNIKEAAVGYYTTERLPQTVGDSQRMTLEEMYDKHLVLKVADKDGNYCDATKSYVSVTKYENEYQMKINLSCDEEEDYIIVYLGCYDYCDANGVCEKKITVSKEKKSNSTPSNSNNESYISNTTSNTEYYSNETKSNTSSNKTSNKVSNSNSNNNELSNSNSNSNSNTTSNTSSNSNSNSNTTSNSNSNDNSNSNSNSNNTEDKCEVKVRNNMTIFFDTVGGSKISNVSFCSDADCKYTDIALPVPTKEGYTFAGWYTDTEYKTLVNITSNKSEDLKKLYIFNMISTLDSDGCGRNDESFAIVYAKWIKDEVEECPTIVGAGVNIVNYDTNGGNKINSLTVCKSCSDASVDRKSPTPVREGYKFLGWYTDKSLSTKVVFESNGLPKNSKWNKVGCYDSETTIYAKWEKIEEEKHEYACEYNISTPGSSSWSDWSKWSTEKVESTSEREVETSVKRVVTGTKTEERVVGTKYEAYISRYATVKKKVGTKKETKVVGYKYEKVAVGTTTQKVLVGTKEIPTGNYVTKTTYVKVPAGYKNVYVESGSGATIPANTNEYTYVKKGSTTSQSCSGCVTKTIYTWDVYKKVIVYKSEARTEQIPVYRTENVYETKQVTVYDTKKVDVYETVETPIYETKTVPVYATREVEIKDNVKIDVYSDVTYYRYRVKQYIGGATESVWSTCDPVDESLINKGYKLTGKKKEA